MKKFLRLIIAVFCIGALVCLAYGFLSRDQRPDASGMTTENIRAMPDESATEPIGISLNQDTAPTIGEQDSPATDSTGKDDETADGLTEDKDSDIAGAGSKEEIHANQEVQMTKSSDSESAEIPDPASEADPAYASDLTDTSAPAADLSADPSADETGRIAVVSGYVSFGGSSEGSRTGREAVTPGSGEAADSGKTSSEPAGIIAVSEENELPDADVTDRGVKSDAVQDGAESKSHGEGSESGVSDPDPDNHAQSSDQGTLNDTGAGVIFPETVRIPLK